LGPLHRRNWWQLPCQGSPPWISSRAGPNPDSDSKIRYSKAILKDLKDLDSTLRFDQIFGNSKKSDCDWWERENVDLPSCKPWVTSCNLVTKLLNKTWNLILPPKLCLYRYSLPYVNITRKIQRFNSKDLDSTSEDSKRFGLIFLGFDPALISSPSLFTKQCYVTV